MRPLTYFFAFITLATLALFIYGCITPGPVTTGPYATANVQKQIYQGSTNNTKALVRNILQKYEGKFADVWGAWRQGDGRLSALKVPAEQLKQMTPNQVSQWADGVAQQRMRLQRARDNKLVDYDRTRAQELQQAQENDNQTKLGVENLIESWRRQGEVSQITAGNVLSVLQTGLEVYQRVEHIRSLRKEAEQAAERKEAEERELLEGAE